MSAAFPSVAHRPAVRPSIVPRPLAAIAAANTAPSSANANLARALAHTHPIGRLQNEASPHHQCNKVGD
jgi:hypothetical protein